MLFLFTDFGWHGPYVGEVRAVLARAQSATPLVDLMHDAPQFNPLASSYLLAALSRQFQSGDYCLAIVDPGVGNTARQPLVMRADGVTYVGPDNGLFGVIATCAQSCTCSEILWRPPGMSASFHGRDLFAPALVQEMAAQPCAKREFDKSQLTGYGCAVSLGEVIYIDAYGNCITGLRETDLDTASILSVNAEALVYAPTFSTVGKDALFWYINSMGLVEIACNQGNAAARLGLSIGSSVVYQQD